jgi:tRNA 5-methylaminomethyl-2-thiouridine biosynthesis bifunctional protein
MLARGELIPGVDGRLCGSFHQNSNDREMAYLSRALESLPELGQVLDAEQASEILGIEQGAAGYWFPGSGWLRPVSVCQALAAAPGVEFIEHCGEIVLHRENDRWHAMVHGEPIASASCAVLATGNGARSQAGLEWLPLQAIRGQTTQLPTSPALSALQAALCHEGYIAPAREGEHCIGATFDLRDHETDQRETDHARNLQALAQAVPAWRGDLDCRDIAELAGRVGYRCASPDYLPIVGPAPDFSQFLQDFAALRKNARQILPARSPCMPGLYLNTAHGSRGLSSTPLAAEYLASTICGECPPLGRELGRALSPARFIIRDLGRNKL